MVFDQCMSYNLTVISNTTCNFTLSFDVLAEGLYQNNRHIKKPTFFTLKPPLLIFKYSSLNISNGGFNVKMKFSLYVCDCDKSLRPRVTLRCFIMIIPGRMISIILSLETSF